MSTRSQLIRIAYNNPAIRPEIIKAIQKQDDIIRDRMVQASLNFHWDQIKTANVDSEEFWYRATRSFVKQIPNPYRGRLQAVVSGIERTGDIEDAPETLKAFAFKLARENHIPSSVMRGINTVVNMLSPSRILNLLVKGWEEIKGWVEKLTSSVRDFFDWGDKVAGGGSGAILTLIMIIIGFCLLVAGAIQAGTGGVALGILAGIIGVPLSVATWQNLRSRLA